MSKKVTNYTVKQIIALNEEREGGSTAEFTRKLDLTQNNYHSWIHRNAPPKAETLGKMCDVYGVAPEWFFEGDDPLIQRIRSAMGKRPAKDREQPSLQTSYDTVAELKGEIDALKKEKERLLKLVESQQKMLESNAEAIKTLSAGFAQKSSVDMGAAVRSKVRV